LDIDRAVFAGRPAGMQTLTVAGDAIERPGNYRVPFGVSVSTILERVGVRGRLERLVVSNALSGAALSTLETVLVPGVEGLFGWTMSGAEERGPIGCLRCGFCIDVCPVGIDPVGAYNAVELGRAERISTPVLQACIDCGLCDYVCPALLPLMEAVQRARMERVGGELA
jgi:electron transport complex protein RnfC